MKFLKENRKRSGGQALTEYAFMLVIGVGFSVLFFVLLAALSEYGTRLIGLVSWEPSPASRSQLESIIKGNI